jgi:flagellar biosynthesis GTPase FlhF
MEQHLAPLRPLSRELSARGMPAALVSELLSEIVSEFGSQVLAGEQDARLALVEQILLRVDGDPLVPEEGALTGSYLISGPAGSGKSVLLSRLALIAAQRGQREVILVNTEGDRLGAAAQMQAIGSVFGFQTINCYAPQELRALQARCGYNVLLLIEAAGWSPSGGVDRQRNAWSWQLPNVKNVLTLPATGQTDDLVELLTAANQMARVPLTVLSKVSETRNLLPAVSALAAQRQPVAMVAPGPNLLEPLPAMDLPQIVRHAVGAVNSHKKKGRVWC